MGMDFPPLRLAFSISFTSYSSSSLSRASRISLDNRENQASSFSGSPSRARRLRNRFSSVGVANSSTSRGLPPFGSRTRWTALCALVLTYDHLVGLSRRKRRCRNSIHDSRIIPYGPSFRRVLSEQARLHHLAALHEALTLHLLQLSQDAAGAGHYFLRQPREPRHLDAKRLVRAPRHDLV